MQMEVLPADEAMNQELPLRADDAEEMDSKEEKENGRKKTRNNLGVDRQRSWSWPMDAGQRERRDRPQRARVLPPRVRATTENLLHIATSQYRRLVCISLIAVFSISWGFRMHSFATDPGPPLLQNWPTSCPPTWLYATNPEQVLQGYTRVFPDVHSPIPMVEKAWATYQKCWHPDRTQHYGNFSALGVHFASASGERDREHMDSDINRAILERGIDAYDKLTSCMGWPCGARDRIYYDSEDWRLPVETSTLPMACTEPGCQCSWGKATKKLIRVALNPWYDWTTDYPASVEQLRGYEPCGLGAMLHNTRRTLDALPRPRSMHPFYTNKAKSLLFQAPYKYNPVTWWIWLRGNNFFVPGRRTGTDQLSM